MTEASVSRSCRRRRSALALVAAYLPLAAACSGEAFRLADGAAAQGGSFPQLAPTDNLDDAGPGGSGGAPPEPDPSACGELRPGTSADDGETCIEAGTFTMGSSTVSTPSGGYGAHGPEHSVTLAAFILDAKEVTVARFRACVVAGHCTPPSTAGDQGCTYTAASGDQDRLPITCVSWSDAMTFCNWDGGRRLPSEAEWERAARGPNGTTYAWGDDVSCLNAVWGGNVQCPEHGGLLPKPVGSAPRGAAREGAFDLTGNAWEWVADWFGTYSSDAVTDPTGPSTGSTRVQRGGNWQTPPANARALMRRSSVPGAIGPTSFRCARTAPGSLGGIEL